MKQFISASQYIICNHATVPFTNVIFRLGQAFSSALPDHYRHSAASASIPSEFSEDYTEQESPSRHSPVESVDKEEPKQKSMIGTTFIVEPRYHLVYNPNFGRKRKRENLPKNVTEYLKDWLIIHKKHPYPTEKEKQQLAEETGLTVSQISNWFINARRRILQPLLESESAYTTAPQASSSHHPIQHDNASYPHFSRYDNRNSSNNEYTTMADDTNHIVLNPYTNIAHDQDNKSKGKDKQH